MNAPRPNPLGTSLEAIGFARTATGGGGYALMKRVADGAHVLVTGYDGDGLPVYGDGVMVGLYSAERDVEWLVTLARTGDRYAVSERHRDDGVAPAPVQAAIDAILGVQRAGAASA